MFWRKHPISSNSVWPDAREIKLCPSLNISSVSYNNWDNVISSYSSLVFSKTSATHSLSQPSWSPLPVYHTHTNNAQQQNTNCTHTPIKTRRSPLMKNKRIKFCLFSEHTVCITPLSKANKRASVCENNLSPFFMSISISVGAPLEWKFVNGAHSFHSSASRGNTARNSTAFPPLGYHGHVSDRWSPHVWLYFMTS